MVTLHLDKSEKSIDTAAQIIKDGGIVAVPTETVYGLAANALDPSAVRKIFSAKGRPQDNPLIVHVSSVEEIPALVENVDERMYLLAEKFWPGPLTVIQKKSSLIPSEVCAGLDTVAIRLPSNPVMRDVIRKSSVPIAAPSANSSGKPSPTTAEHVITDLDGKIDAVIDGGECDYGVESTVITLATPVPMLLRPGAVTAEELKEVLGRIEISHAVFEKLDSGEKPLSPGMKYKHYSPNTSVTIVKGSFEKYRKFILSQGDDVCAVCFKGEGAYFKKSVEYGEEDDSLSQCHGFFDAMRKVDEMTCGNAYVRCPNWEGAGLAVYNRLLRSAAFKIIDLDYNIGIIGLTGPIGSGKSTVSSYLAGKGYYVIDADILARRAVENSEIIEKIRLEFGDDVFENNVLSRSLLAKKAFSSEENTKKLNCITHPEITRLTFLQIHKAQDNGFDVCVIDAALMPDWGLRYICDKIICVDAPESIRIERVMKRDNLSLENTMSRINRQRKSEDYRKCSDYTVENFDENISKKTVERIIEYERKNRNSVS
ncbi:MAG: threonylcarbamoyl-AMP synthase [Clostridiales bacterium]|nr:threonylcarbamoyl-AMP synthase [Clostridiales bacterium]